MKTVFIIGLALTATALNSDSDGVKCLLGCVGLVAMFFSPVFAKDI